MTPRELIDWGPVRCLDPVTGEVIHEGLVIATTATSVLVRNAAGAQSWFDTANVQAVGADG